MYICNFPSKFTGIPWLLDPISSFLLLIFSIFSWSCDSDLLHHACYTNPNKNARGIPTIYCMHIRHCLKIAPSIIKFVLHPGHALLAATIRRKVQRSQTTRFKTKVFPSCRLKERPAGFWTTLPRRWNTMNHLFHYHVLLIEFLIVLFLKTALYIALWNLCAIYVMYLSVCYLNLCACDF